MTHLSTELTFVELKHLRINLVKEHFQEITWKWSYILPNSCYFILSIYFVPGTVISNLYTLYHLFKNKPKVIIKVYYIWWNLEEWTHHLKVGSGTRIPNLTFSSRAQTAFSCAGLICWHGQEPLLLFLPFVATHFFPDNEFHSYGLQITGIKVLKVSCQSPCQSINILTPTLSLSH